ncbi:uncharacterized protein EAF01_011799 [Botrytis porri]|uniref:uncharacterized protein n=1 Tax=Botrytis porri TaxID=87229 RepID=UPI0018FFA060|nr:uncharacterized protein EAF01_011799 [Botrytis porri]KAF7882019.1 hypothetical protein EAF01_011799 [Botrytis porri]
MPPKSCTMLTLLMSLFSLLSLTTSHTLTFQNLFSSPRLIIFTPNSDSYSIPPQTVAPSQLLSLSVPDWSGNFKAVDPDLYDIEHPGLEKYILGEVCFGCWQDITFFYVSAIWNCCDNEGVHWMWGYDDDRNRTGEGEYEPTREDAIEGDISGCERFPCEEVYNESDDVQTKTTTKHAIWVVLGP